METFGLNELPKDDRDFKLGSIFDLPEPLDLPIGFLLSKSIIKNQGNTDYCTAFASTSMSEMQEGIELSPLYSFALSKELSGEPEVWGQDLRYAMKAHVKFGAIPEEESEYKVLTDLQNTNVRYLKKWVKTYQPLRSKYAKKSYFQVKGDYDSFDDIRSALWQFRGQKQAAEIGVMWSWSVNEKFLTKETSTGDRGGHAVLVIGWETIEEVPYLIIQNSYGLGAGENGLHYISREVINENVDKFGAYMMVDLDPEEAQHMIDNGIRHSDSWLAAIFKGIFLLIKAFFTPNKISGESPKNN